MVGRGEVWLARLDPIEHGQDNVISGNRFLHDSVAIKLWADSIEPSDWGYPKHHDTRSRD